MSQTVTSNSVTFIDLTDSRKLTTYIASNLPITQIYNKNTKVYTPDWSSTNLQLSATTFLDSKDVTTDTNTTVVWYKKTPTQSKTQIGTGATLKITGNQLANSDGIITYICEAKYGDTTDNPPTTSAEISFARVDTGLNGSDGTGVTILGSYNTLAELQAAHPTGSKGDAYIVDGDLYVWAANNNTWKNVGNIQGPAGNDAKGIILNGSSQVFKVNKSNTITPSTISVTAQTINTSITTWTYSTNGGRSFLSTVPNGVVISGNTVTITGANMTDNSIVIKASDGTYSDTYTIHKVVDGADGTNGTNGSSAPIAFLSNENISFSANAQGQIAATSTTSNIVAYVGTTKTLPIIGEITGVPTGMTITQKTITSTNSIVLTIAIADKATLGSTSSNNGTINIPITSPVGTTLSLNWSKINTGATGEKGESGSDAYTVILTNESNTFAGNTSTAIAGSADTKIIAYKGSKEQSVTITSVNGVQASTTETATGIVGLTFRCSALSGTSPTITFKCTNSFISPSGVIPIVVTIDGVSITKMFSYSIAFKGATGPQGEIGESASAYWLVASTSAIQKTTSGTVAVTPSSITFTGKSQTGTSTPIDYECRWIISYSNDGVNYIDVYTSQKNESYVSVNVSTSYKSIRARMYLAGGTAILLDEQIVPVVSDGKGIKSVMEYYLATTSNTGITTSTEGWTTSIQTITATKKYLWRYEMITYTDNTAIITNPVIIGVYGDRGVPAVTFNVYAPNGYLLTKDINALTLQAFAYEGGTKITSGATFQWGHFVDNAWDDIDEVSDVLVISKDDVLKAQSYRCVMTYKGQTYTSIATVQDKTDIYDSIMCISSNATGNNCYWVLYTLVYSDIGEVDPLLGPISISAPSSPENGDYWYAVDEENATVSLKKYNGISWLTSTDSQSLSYYWDIIDNGSINVPLGDSSKVKIVSCNDFTSTATLVCKVNSIESGLLTQSSLSITDASDPIVSTDEPTSVVNGQIWIKPNGNGTYLMFVWDATLNNWISSDVDTRSRVYTSRPTSYNAGDLWVTASDTDHGLYLHGTLLQAQNTNTIYDATDWSPTLRYDQDIDEMKETLNNLSQYVTITSAGLRIGARDTAGTLSPFTSLFTSTELSFYQNAEKLLTLANNKLIAPRIEVENDLIVQGSIGLGNLRLIIESNGSFSFAVQK